MSEVNEQIKKTIEENNVVLYMKGNKSMPQCGFSSKVAGVLNYIGVDYEDINVLADEVIRQGIKDFSDWPTIPQLYVKGEFVGGCDIITEMALSGELDNLLEKNGKEVLGLITVVELTKLEGRSKFNFPVESVISF